MIPNPFSELPLAIFTTMMPIGAGGLIALLIAALTAKDEDAAKAFDRLFIVPIAIWVIGFIGAFFHLASPLHAVFAFAGLGTSPLSTEVLVALIAVALAVAYWAIAKVGCMSRKARLFFAPLLVLSCVGLAIFTGLAYRIDTIETWSSPWASVATIGYLLAGLVVTIAAARIANKPMNDTLSTVLSASAVAGVLMAIVCNIMFFAPVGEASTALIQGSSLLAAASPYLIISCLVALAAVACMVLAVFKGNERALLAVAGACVVVSLFCVRLAFYCVEMNVGL